MACTRTGCVHLAVDAQDVTVVQRTDDTLTVESEHILAVTAGLRIDARFAVLRCVMSEQGLATTAVIPLHADTQELGRDPRNRGQTDGPPDGMVRSAAVLVAARIGAHVFTYVASASQSGNENIRRTCSHCAGVFYISYGAQNYRCPHCDWKQ